MNDKLKETIAARIEALLNKTTENGATEEEALMAMQKASELMAKYQLNMTEVQLAAEGLTHCAIEFKSSLEEQLAFKLCLAIGAATETRVWRIDGFGSVRPKFSFFGLRSDVDFAEYLLKTLVQFAMSDVAIWWRDPANYVSGVPAGERARLKLSFLHGFALKVSERVRAMNNGLVERDSSRSGKGLVPLSTAKKSMIDEKLIDKKFRSAGADRKHYEQEAVHSGWQRGDSASLNRGLAQNEVRRIK